MQKVVGLVISTFSGQMLREDATGLQSVSTLKSDSLMASYLFVIDLVEWKQCLMHGYMKAKSLFCSTDAFEK